jgi:hypothetical protein
MLGATARLQTPAPALEGGLQQADGLPQLVDPPLELLKLALGQICHGGESSSSRAISSKVNPARWQSRTARIRCSALRS